MFAITGSSGLSTFDRNANDLSFDEADLQAVEYLRTTGQIRRTTAPLPSDDDLLFADYPERVQIYTDPTSYHLLRSTLPPDYYSTELVQLKNQWRPSVSPMGIDSGYILLREEAIAQTQNTPSASKLSAQEAAELHDLGTVVYDREGVQIIRVTATG